MSLNEREILTHAGKISHEMAREMAEAEYELFSQRRIREKDRLDGDFEKTIKQLNKKGVRFSRTPFLDVAILSVNFSHRSPLYAS